MAFMNGSGPNEQSTLWKLKVRLQWSGWLQYAPNAAAALLCFALAAAAGTVGCSGPPFACGVLLTGVLLFDLVTVKCGLHPAETAGQPHRGTPFELMRDRRSCRSFQRRSLRPEHLKEILDVAEAETQMGALLGHQRIRLEYVSAPLKVWPVVGCSEFLVAVAPAAYDRLAVLDVGRSLQKVVLHATRLGLATCWIGPGADHGSVIRHLNGRFSQADDHVVCVCVLGYRSRYIPRAIALIMGRMSKQRLPVSSLFFADAEMQRPLAIDSVPFKHFGLCYEGCRWAPSSFNAQPTRCVGALEEDGTLRFDFYAATASRWYAPVALGIWLANWELGCRHLGLPGHFERLPAARRGAPEGEGPPAYGISWIFGYKHG